MTVTDPSTAVEIPAPEADTDRPDRATFDAIVGRLSEQSLRKRFDAYLDITWDDPGYAIAADDLRWELPAALGGLAATDWYRSQPPARRAEIGLYAVVAGARVGREFEGVLKRGLLGFATTLDDGDPVFRYVYHEVIEESQHSLMFQEFVNRSGQPVPGLPRPIRLLTHGIVQLGHLFPELFFLFVLGGEEPVDRLQRDSLRHADERHPLLNRINQIHITEEARHLSFAVHYLRRRAPEIGPVRRRVLAAVAPYLLGVMARLMLQPSPAMIRRFDIPRSVLREAYGHDPVFRQRKRDAVRRIRKLCRDLDIISPVDRLVWKAFGIWADD
jgi:hypothetical protein